MRFTFIHRERTLFPITALCRVLRVSCSGYHAWGWSCAQRTQDGRSIACRRNRRRICAKSKDLRQSTNPRRVVVAWHACRSTPHRTQCARAILLDCRAKSRVGYRCESDSHWRRMAVLGRRDRSVFTTCCRSRDEREQRHHACIASAQQCKGCPWTHQQSRASLRSRLSLWKRHRQRATRFVSHAPLGRNSFATHSQAHRAVSEYIDQFFNPIRRHSTNGYLSPIMFELCWQTRQLTVESTCPRNAGKRTLSVELDEFKFTLAPITLYSLTPQLSLHRLPARIFAARCSNGSASIFRVVARYRAARLLRLLAT